MRIANPIYDVVFKYLMEDHKIAKLLVSKIIGEEVEEIDFQPRENIVRVATQEEPKDKPMASFTVYRLDFSAKISTAEGQLKQVIIEIQKAKLPTDIMRFRKYLGRQYATEANSTTVQKDGRKYTQAFPIISIYFLGHSLEHETAPVIRVSRQYTDIATGEELTNKEEFIESLPSSYVIQIPQLEGRRRNELEILLSVFDQSQRESNHILNVDERDFPDEISTVIRKLQKAILDEEIQTTMDIEDEILDVLGERQREIEDLKEAVVKNREVILEKDKELSQKDKEIEMLRKLLDGKK